MFLRKKPPQPITTLQNTFNDATNQSIQNYELEKQNHIKRAFQGWKSLHTNLLYQLDHINNNYSIDTFSNEENSLYFEIKYLNNRAKENMGRLEVLLIKELSDLNKSFQALNGGANANSNSYTNRSPTASINSNTLNPQISHTQSQSQSLQPQPQPQQRSMLRTLRSPKHHTNESSGSSKFHSSRFANNYSSPSLISKTAANKIWKDEEKAHHRTLSNKDDANNNGNAAADLFKDFSDIMDRDEVLNKHSRKNSATNLTNSNFNKRFEAASNKPLVASNLLKKSPNNSLVNPTTSPSTPTPAVFTKQSKKTKPLKPQKPAIIKLPIIPPPPPKPRITVASTSKTLNVGSHHTPKVSSSALKASQISAAYTKKYKPVVTSISSTAAPTAATTAATTKSKHKPAPAPAPASSQYLDVKRPSVKKIQSEPSTRNTSPGRTSTSSKPSPLTAGGTSANVRRGNNNGNSPKAAKNAAKTHSLDSKSRKATTSAFATVSHSSDEDGADYINDDEKDTETIISDNNTDGSGNNVDLQDELGISESQIQEAMQNRIISQIKGIDENAAKQIFNEIVDLGDEVHWEDIAGLEVAKNSLKEAVVYPFLRPDLFSGLREPARGMLLFGPPGTGKTMLAKAVATESKSTFFSISASSLTSKFLGESEKLVRALFLLAKKLSPSIIFVDEIDSLLSARSDNENESSRRIKTEFLIQWNDLSHAAVGSTKNNKNSTEPQPRVLVLAATNLPWNIDEAARRRFVRRQYIPLPEATTRRAQFQKMLAHQNNNISEEELEELVKITEGFSGSDITALTKDAAMNPLRELGEKLLFMPKEDIRGLELNDFMVSLKYIRPSVSSEGLSKFDDWASKYGSSGA